MLPRVFNVFFGGAVGQVSERGKGKGVKLEDESGGGLENKQELYGDEIPVVAKSRELVHIVNESRAFKVYSEVVVVRKDQITKTKKVRVS